MSASCPVCNNVVHYRFNDDGFCATCSSCGAVTVLKNFEESKINNLFTTIKNGEKVPAIKEFRSLTGCGLKFSEIFVDKIMELHSIINGDLNW